MISIHKIGIQHDARRTCQSIWGTIGYHRVDYGINFWIDDWIRPATLFPAGADNIAAICAGTEEDEHSYGAKHSHVLRIGICLVKLKSFRFFC